jgi:hypothetical protein
MTTIPREIERKQGIVIPSEARDLKRPTVQKVVNPDRINQNAPHYAGLSFTNNYLSRQGFLIPLARDSE